MKNTTKRCITAEKLETLLRSEGVALLEDDIFAGTNYDPEPEKLEKPAVAARTPHITLVVNQDGSARVADPRGRREYIARGSLFTKDGKISSRAVKKMLQQGATADDVYNIAHQLGRSVEGEQASQLWLPGTGGRIQKGGSIAPSVQYGRRENPYLIQGPMYEPSYSQTSQHALVTPFIPASGVGSAWMNDPQVMALLRREGLGTFERKSGSAIEKIINLAGNRGYHVSFQEVNKLFRDAYQTSVRNQDPQNYAWANDPRAIDIFRHFAGKTGGRNVERYINDIIAALQHLGYTPTYDTALRWIEFISKTSYYQVGQTVMSPEPAETTAYPSPHAAARWYRHPGVLQQILMPAGFGNIPAIETPSEEQLILHKLKTLFNYNVTEQELRQVFADEYQRMASFSSGTATAMRNIGAIGQEYASDFVQSLRNHIPDPSQLGQIAATAKTGGRLAGKAGLGISGFLENIISVAINAAFASFWKKLRFSRFLRSIPVFSYFANDRTRILLAIRQELEKDPHVHSLLASVGKSNIEEVIKEISDQLGLIETTARKNYTDTKQEQLKAVLDLERKATREYNVSVKELDQKYKGQLVYAKTQIQGAKQKELADIQTRYAKGTAKASDVRRSIQQETPVAVANIKASDLQNLVTAIHQKYGKEVSYAL